jgi:Arylsulfotransferase (ASST)
MSKLFLPLSLFLIFFQLLPTANCQVGLKINDKRAFQSYALYPEEGNAQVKLLNMEGETVHSWAVDASRARLLPNCNLLVVHGTKWGNQREPWRSLRKSIVEYSWEGKPVWQYTNEEVLHHDVTRIGDETIFLKRTIVPLEFQLQIQDITRRNRTQRADSILIVNLKGETVFQWDAHTHLDINYAGPKGFTKVSQASGGELRINDWTHINTAGVIPENKWYDAGDIRFKPGNIISQIRNWSRSIIIDRETKKVVWQYTGDYKGGIGGGHDPKMIAKGKSGAGNILIFDNGKLKHQKHSIILEINPVTKKVVWTYEDPNFFSYAGGTLDRLPNGNTLISEDRRRRLFEVTPKKEIVWEYQGEYKINRALKYPINYCPKLAELKGASGAGIMARLKGLWPFKFN